MPRRSLSGVLYPLRDQLHPHGLTEFLLRVLPASAAPGVAVIHNWPYTLFYICSELWVRGQALLTQLLPHMQDHAPLAGFPEPAASRLCSLRSALALCSPRRPAVRC